jgi:hypothetical protein
MGMTAAGWELPLLVIPAKEAVKKWWLGATPAQIDEHHSEMAQRATPGMTAFDIFSHTP